MSSVTDYAKEWLVTCPDDDVPASLLEWANGKAVLPVSEHASLDSIIREWWAAQTDARDLLRETISVDQRTGVLGACACARWALERYWQSDGRRPWIAVETTEAWCRGEVMTHHVVGAAFAALMVANAVRDAREAPEAAYASYAAYAASYAAYAADTGMFPQDAANAADAAANAAASADPRKGIKTDSLRELCDVVRAAIECPPVEVWFAIELKRDLQ